MTTRDEAIKAVAGVLSTKQNSIEWQTAMLGDGHGTVSTGDNTVYCRLTANSSVVEVLNYRVAPVDGLLVRIAKTPEMPLHWQVIGQADQRADEGSATVTGGIIYNTPPHHKTHEYLGVDQVNIDWRQITTLRVYAYSGFTVGVLAGLLPRPGADLVVPTQTLDLSSNVPSSGGARFVLISVDSTGTLVATNGAVATGILSLTLADIPDTPSGNFRLAAVRLYAGQSAISESLSSNDIRDLRWPQERLAGDVYEQFGNQAAKTFLGGPQSGADAYPTFRLLYDADIPDTIARRSDVTNGIALYPAVDMTLPATVPASGEVIMWEPDPLFTPIDEWVYDFTSAANPVTRIKAGVWALKGLFKTPGLMAPTIGLNVDLLIVDNLGGETTISHTENILQKFTDRLVAEIRGTIAADVELEDGDTIVLRFRSAYYEIPDPIYYQFSLYVGDQPEIITQVVIPSDENIPLASTHFFVGNSDNFATDAGAGLTYATATNRLSVDNVQFDLTPTPTSAAEGLMYWNAEDGTLNLGMPGGSVNLQIGQEMIMRAKNETGSPITNGQLVYISGGTGNNAIISLAKADAEITSATTIGMATEAIADNHFGYVTLIGLVRDVNTIAYTAGTSLYLSAATAGAYTSTKPTAPNHLVTIGVVIRQHATEGVIFVRIDNGYELSELHDVYISSIADGNILQYVNANSRWENKTLASAGIISGTPGTLTVSSTNAATDPHTHAITSSAAITAAGASLLAVDTNGHLRLFTQSIGAALPANTSKLFVSDSATGSSVLGAVNMSRTLTNPTGSSQRTATFTIEGRFTSAANGGELFGFVANATVGATNTQAWNGNGGASQAGLVGFVANTQVTSGAAGTISYIHSGLFRGAHEASNTVTNWILAKIENPQLTGGGSITNLYGLRIEALTRGGTLNRAIDTAGGQLNFLHNADSTLATFTGHSTFTAGTTLVQMTRNDANTNAVGTVLTLAHNSTGTAAASFGLRTNYTLESSTTADQVAGYDDRLWTDATHASRTVLYRGTTTGNAVNSGFYGAWSHNAIANTSITIIPNGTGDVASVGTFVFTVKDNTSATTNGGIVVVNPGGGAISLLSDGTDTLQITCAADGSVTIARSAGTHTFSVSLWGTWQ